MVGTGGPGRSAAAPRRSHALLQNARIDLPDGGHLVVDFLWPELRANLEIGSDLHHALAGNADGTADRHLILETLGFSVVHRRPRLVTAQPQLFVLDHVPEGRRADPTVRCPRRNAR